MNKKIVFTAGIVHKLLGVRTNITLNIVKNTGSHPQKYQVVQSMQ